MQWYGYKHINGTLHLKRYWGDYGDIEEAESSDFVAQVYGPFDANTREEAANTLNNLANRD